MTSRDVKCHPCVLLVPQQFVLHVLVDFQEHWFMMMYGGFRVLHGRECYVPPLQEGVFQVTLANGYIRTCNAGLPYIHVQLAVNHQPGYRQGNW